MLDSAQVVAEALGYQLSKENLLNSIGNAHLQFIVSDFTESFEASTQLFFGEKVKLEWHPLWN